MTWTMNYRYDPTRMEPEEIEPVLACDLCHEDIYENETYYEWGSGCYCEYCFNNEAYRILLNEGARKMVAEHDC